ncbi:hypothetical protein [Ferruginivarius sediminum]|uniref:hypothetical protein n=1 Tax=Ferruginivarius sediminum TaxID=2661937 RepID=UPI0011C039F7|nr:hypothetical protein [Ferruginivarius sediminum]
MGSRLRLEELYDKPDCGAYYRAMREVGYGTPRHLMPIARAALAEVVRLRGEVAPVVLEFGCGYGIGSAMLRHDVTLDEVLRRYASPEMQGLSTLELADNDWDWFAARRRPGPHPHVAGLDKAGYALAYGHATGIFDEIFREDLQQESPSRPLARRLSRCAMIIEVGASAHLLPNALDRILACVGQPAPWFVMSPVQGGDFGIAIERLEAAGLRVERLPIPPFVHRRFLDDGERARTLESLRARGLDPSRTESSDSLHAQIYIARQPGECTPFGDWAHKAADSVPVGA